MLNRPTRGRLAAGSLETPGLAKQTLVVPLQATTSTTPVLSGKRLPAKAIVTGVYVDMLSVASAATPLLDIGVSSSTQGFHIGTNVGSTGVKRASAASGSVTFGVLMLDANGVAPVPSEYVAPASIEVTYATRSVASRLQGNVIVEYKLPTGQ